MIKKFCSVCGQNTWHNPTKAEGRCVQCGHPKRYGSKNYLLRVNGKLIADPKV